MDKTTYHKLYWQKNKATLKEKTKEWRKNNKNRVLETQKKWIEKNKEHYLEWRRNWGKAYQVKRKFKLRVEAIEKYGGRCVCCGEDEYKFLTIDHINNDGAEHRKKVPISYLTEWLKRNKYPSGFQLLCYNCNMAKGHYGTCPHKITPQK